IGKSHSGSGLNPGAGRKVTIFDVSIADFDFVDPLGDRAAGPGNSLRGWRRPQRSELSFQRKGPDCVTVGAPLDRVAAGGDGDVLITIDLVNRRRSVGPKPGLKFPQ